tara:strand:- start:1130 stop:1654 length:525 start_codon:yes stop_codon:yes gene_type:complete
MTREQAAACKRFLKENKTLLAIAPGSTGNHQSWPGGYLGHIEEVLKLAMIYYKALSEFRELPFSLGDAMFVLFLHDIEKPWRIVGEPGHYKSGFPKAESHTFQLGKLREYGFDQLMTDEMENALKYVEGEKDDYTQGQRVMNEMAAFCHVCDVTSARIFYAHPAPPVLAGGPDE